MREIKFRCWSKTNKKMVQVHSIEFATQFVNLNGMAWSLPVQISELMQYTGLKDKNGVDIYERDILRFVDEFGFLAKVVWDDHYAKFYLEGIDPVDNFDFENYDPLSLEVIGNIYENPELLK